MADELKKIIPINLNLTETNVFKNETYQTNETFWTSDVNSAYLEFTTETAITSGTASLVLKNVDDGSVIQRVIELSESTFEYMLREKEVKRAGRWYGQVVVNSDGKYLTAISFRFLIKGGLLDSSEPALFDIENYTKLSEQLVLLYDQLGSYLADAALSESEREIAETTRSGLFTDSQTARKASFEDSQVDKDTVFAESELDRTSTFTESESARQVEYITNKSSFDNTLTELETFVNDDATEARFDEKYSELEETYATNLTALKTSDTSLTAQLAQTKLDFNAAVNGITVDSEVILARGDELVLDDRLKKMDIEIATLDKDVVVSTTNLLKKNQYVLTGYASQIGESVSLLKNNKYYVSRDYVIINGISNAISGRISIGSYVVINGYTTSSKSIVYTHIDNDYTGAITIYGGTGDGTDGTRLSYYNNNTIINLTKTFGVGNEPTVTQMDNLMKQFSNSWFDGTVNIYNSKNMMGMFFKELTKLNNAVIALGGNV